ncbi:hypothetical protein E8E13_009771 [Curvularia kusanoi]|uniref:WSC domain-containing protein n=1 Tax=Curvularia kusanoi TaxID=90978 RepID=A0A9P4TLB8_CURKU|nr:hypothetical protein E8E13_009771 [Curvularia kusanoi]
MFRPLLALTVLAHHASSQRYQYDQRTTPDCVLWADIDDSTTQTCESTLRDWSLEPVRFRAWNPSVGTDCTPWFNQTSYCVVTTAEIEDSVNYTTSTDTSAGYTLALPLPSMTTDSAGWRIPVTRSDAPARTTSTRAPIPSPSTWTDTGCYVDTFNDDDNLPPAEWVWILDFRFRPVNPFETVESCKFKCWQIQYPIAGLKGRDECYCGDRNNGTLAADQGECNMPCGGDKSVMCGGTERTRVFEAKGYDKAGGDASASTRATTSLRGASTGVTETGTGVHSTPSSGAVRKAALFGLLRL